MGGRLGTVLGVGASGEGAAGMGVGEVERKREQEKITIVQTSHYYIIHKECMTKIIDCMPPQCKMSVNVPPSFAPAQCSVGYINTAQKHNDSVLRP